MPSTLTNIDKAWLRREFAKQQRGNVNWTKREINAAFDALDAKHEDSWGGDGNNAIDASTSFNFTNEQMRKIFKFWFKKKFEKV